MTAPSRLAASRQWIVPLLVPIAVAVVGAPALNPPPGAKVHDALGAGEEAGG
jgi:hypothetical protein